MYGGLGIAGPYVCGAGELRVRTYVAQVDGIRAQLWETFPNGKNGEPSSGNEADCELRNKCHLCSELCSTDLVAQRIRAGPALFSKSLWSIALFSKSL